MTGFLGLFSGRDPLGLPFGFHLLMSLPIWVAVFVPSLVIFGSWLIVRKGVEGRRYGWSGQMPSTAIGYPFMAGILGVGVLVVRRMSNITTYNNWWQSGIFHATALLIAISIVLVVVTAEIGETKRTPYRKHTHCSWNYYSPSKVLWYFLTTCNIYLLLVVTMAVCAPAGVPWGVKTVNVFAIVIFAIILLADMTWQDGEIDYAHPARAFGHHFGGYKPSEPLKRTSVLDEVPPAAHEPFGTARRYDDTLAGTTRTRGWDDEFPTRVGETNYDRTRYDDTDGTGYRRPSPASRLSFDDEPVTPAPTQTSAAAYQAPPPAAEPAVTRLPESDTGYGNRKPTNDAPFSTENTGPKVTRIQY